MDAIDPSGADARHPNRSSGSGRERRVRDRQPGCTAATSPRASGRWSRPTELAAAIAQAVNQAAASRGQKTAAGPRTLGSPR
ncbi:MAG TPA: hypothetical protein VEH84_01735 [Alphaproteobacteria bacterium]|nr:hypothetical protein [Alphaproteobacteria bacterium]